VLALATAEKLTSLASRFVGASPFPYKATLFEKSAAAPWLVPWHQDRALPLRSVPTSPDWGASSVKAGVLHVHAPARVLEKVIALRVHLDPSTASNGPLRALPGTHRLGILPEEAIERLAREIPGVECLASTGGVIAMRPLIVHASSKPLGPAPRRVLHIEYAPEGGFGNEAELADC
jgi:ectoine hydroxylase-related dioxygenase (phytanoyl-CoA dioxygenase family)